MSDRTLDLDRLGVAALDAAELDTTGSGALAAMLLGAALYALADWLLS